MSTYTIIPPGSVVPGSLICSLMDSIDPDIESGLLSIDGVHGHPIQDLYTYQDIRLTMHKNASQEAFLPHIEKVRKAASRLFINITSNKS